MNYRPWCLTLAFITALTAAVAVQEKGGEDETGPYVVVENWLKPVHEGWYHHVTGVFAQTPNRIFITASGETPIPPAPSRGQRGAPPSAGGRGGFGGFDPTRPGAKTDHFIVVVDRDGKKIEEWTQAVPLLVRPHTVEISPYDPDKHVWIVDREGQQIVKFTNDGTRVVMTLGEKGVAGTDEKHFDRPADLAFLPDGSFYVADGYSNSRVVKFDKNGKFLMTWGTKGTGPGQFNLVHCVAVDKNGRVYVADRTNGRIQIFDAGGKFIEQWPARHPQHLLVTTDQFLWMADGTTNRFVKYDLAGKLLTYWGVTGAFPGAMDDPHKFSVDTDGNVYVADYLNNRVQKFTPRPGADRSRLVGQPFK